MNHDQQQRIAELDPLPLHAPHRIHGWLIQAWENNQHEVGQWILDHCDHSISLSFDSNLTSMPRTVVRQAWETGEMAWLDRFLAYGMDLDYLIDSQSSALFECLQWVKEVPVEHDPFRAHPLEKLWSRLLRYSKRTGGFDGVDANLSELMQDALAARRTQCHQAGVSCKDFAQKWSALIHATREWEGRTHRYLAREKEAIHAFEGGRLEQVKKALAPLRAIPQPLRGVNVFTYAVTGKDPRYTCALIDLLVEDGFDLNARQPNGMTALTVFCSLVREHALSGNEQVLEHLLSKGADPNVCTGWNCREDRHAQRFSPLSAATYYGHEGMVNRLIEAGARVNHQEGSGRTPLHDALEYREWACAYALLQNGANPSLRSDLGEDALGALMSGTTEWRSEDLDPMIDIARKLTREYRLSLDHVEVDGATPRERGRACQGLREIVAQLEQDMLLQGTPAVVWRRPTRRF